MKSEEKKSTLVPLTLIFQTLSILLTLANCGSTPGSMKERLTERLRASLASGELGEPACATVSSNVRPLVQGFDDIRYDLIPGAHRVVVANTGSGWRMTWGVPELTVFSQAGFFTVMETTVTSSNGATYPAREYRLTRKGYEAMVRSGSACFAYRSFDSVEIVSVDEMRLPATLSGLGRGYRVKYKLRFSEPAAWANTPEFRYVFTKIYISPNEGSGGVEQERNFFYSGGRWFDEQEAMTALARDAATVRNPQLREQLEREKLVVQTIKNSASTPPRLTPERLRSMLSEEKRRRQLDPCFQLPVNESDLTRGFWKNDGPPTLVFYEALTRHDKSKYEYAIETARRLEKAGLAKAEPFDGEPFPGGREGKGIRYVLDESLSTALEPQRASCLPLGEAKIESLRIASASGKQGIGFRGWAQVVNHQPWDVALAGQFPNVQSILNSGYGFAGVMHIGDGKDWVNAQVDAPRFALTDPARPFEILTLPATKDGPGVVDRSSDGVVRMSMKGCNISSDGTEVSAADAIPCMAASATRGFRRGKAYAEIIFRAKQRGGHPDTWTNAALTSPRSLSSVSTGAALFSFAGTYTKNQIKDGDLIGIALDMDEQVLYWHLNGEWMTGRPGSGIGEPLVDVGQEYFIAVSVQDKSESWRVNFGATPFRFSPPEGYPPYGATYGG